MILDAICLSPKVTIHKGDEIPFVEMANVAIGNRKDPMAIEMRKFSGGTKFEKGDSVVASIEPCLQHGKSFYFTEYDKGAGSTEYLVFRGIDGITTNEFVYYFMMSYGIRAAMIRSMKGATGRQRVDPEVFTGMKIELHDIPTQEKIAAILSDYDAAIANCRKQIALLEEAAMRLYREWFGDGKGEKRPFNDVCDVLYGKPHKDIADGDIPIFGSGGIMRYGNRAKYCDESVLIPRKGTLDNIMYVDEPFWVVDTMFYTHFKITNMAKVTYFQLLNLNMSAMNTGSAVPSMTTDTLSKIKLMVPSAESRRRFDEHVDKMYMLRRKLKQHIKTLTEARDRLLPKLMKGEIEV